MKQRLLVAIAFVCASTMLFETPLVLADTAPARFDGRPKFSEGKALGYFVWNDGDTWKLAGRPLAPSTGSPAVFTLKVARSRR